jgi:putative transcription factor
MAKCEICGSNIMGDPFKVEIDGAVMRVCGRCSRLGRPVKEPLAPVPTAKTSSEGAMPVYRRPAAVVPDEELVIREDYSAVIRKARESAGLTQEQLGMKVNEKSSVIAKLESGKLKLSVPLAKKLENIMKIRLFELAES